MSLSLWYFHMFCTDIDVKAIPFSADNSSNSSCSPSKRIPLHFRAKMVDYEVTVFTADHTKATTFSNIYIKLVGTDGESNRKWLISLKGAAAFMRNAVSATFPSLCPKYASLSIWPNSCWASKMSSKTERWPKMTGMLLTLFRYLILLWAALSPSESWFW